MSFISIAKKRYTVRKYKDTPVMEDDILLILEAGRLAPTGANAQPQRIIVVQTKDGLEKLAKSATTFGAPVAFIVCGDKDKVWARPSDGKKIIEIDASIVATHMMLQATEIGIGTAWICNFKSEQVKKDFNIPNSVDPVVILTAGYPDGQEVSPDRHEKTRKKLEDTVFFEKM